MPNETNKPQQGLTLNEFYDKPAIYEVNGEEIKLTPAMVKSYLARGNEELTQQEIVMFINLCKFQKLNPFLNEAYIVKFKNANGPAIAQLIMSKEAYMKRAYDCPDFDGLKAGIIVQRGNDIIDLEGSFCLEGDVLLGGWAIVFVKNKKYPSVSRISLREFSKGQSTWKSMPATMIRKVAEVNALREAFPKELGSLYTEDEPTFDKGNVVQTVENVKQEVAQQTGSVQPPIVKPQPTATSPKPTVEQPKVVNVTPTPATVISDEEAEKKFAAENIGKTESELPF